MKILNIIIAAIFLLFAIVQYNDPDPWGWMALYTMVAGISAFAAFKKYNRWIILTGIVICLIWLGFLIPEFIHWIQMGMPNIAETMKAEEPHIEYTREFLGLFLCLIVLGFHYFKARKN